MPSLSRFVNWKILLFISVVLVIAFFTLSKSESIDNFEQREYEAYDVTHPFPIQATNLIEREDEDNSTFQSRLNKYDVRAALDSVLIAQDFKMVVDTLLTLEGLTIPITAFDPETKIGYVWLDYDRFGEGILDKKLGESKSQKQCENDFLKSIDDGIELYFDDEETFLLDVFGKGDPEDIKRKEEVEADWRLTMDSLSRGEVLFSDINAKYRIYQEVMNIESSILDVWDYFGKTLELDKQFVRTYGEEVRGQLEALSTFASKKEYLEIMLKEFRKILEVNYLSAKQNKTMIDEWKLSAAKVIKDPVRFFGFIFLVDHIRLHRPNKNLLTALNDQIFQIDLYSSSKDWWKHSKAIIELFNVNKDPGLYNKVSYQNLLSDIIIKSKYTKWNKRYNEIQSLGDTENISLNELKALDFLAFQKGIYIAPVSILDNRLIYDMEENIYLAKLDTLRKNMTLSKSKKERKKLQKELLELTTDRSTNYNDIRKKAKKKSLDVLYDDFVKYVIWAKQELERRKMESGV